MNIIDKVAVTRQVTKNWHKVARLAVQELAAKGEDYSLEHPGVEEIHLQPDGSLEIRCEVGKHSVRMRVEPEDWRYSNHEQHILETP